MKFMSAVRLKFFRWQQKLLYTFVKTTRIGPDTKEFSLDSDCPVVYATHSPSYAEQLVIDNEVISQGWQSPKAKWLDNTLPVKPFFSLYKRTGIFRKQGSPNVSKQLIQMAELATKTHPENNIQIIPVRIFWGRAPDKEGSFLRIWLQNSGSLGGRLVTLMAILFNGRNTFVHFSKPLRIKDLHEQEETPEVVARKIARILRVHSRQVSTSVLGPDLSHRRTLVHNIPNKPMVHKAILEEMERKHTSKDKIQKLALKYADEIASNISYTNIRFLDIVLTWVWNKLYDGINLHNIEPLKEIGKDSEIIYVPCHRSHIDYLLLSYILYHQGLQLPQIAAGINLNIPVIGPILRRGGAFFMRRTFRDNKLYAAVFDEYLHSVFSQGYAAEYFIEGGRSRTGRTLFPKAGMLAMTLRSYLRDSRKPIVFMPVYTGYEKVFEASSYAGELRGKKKKKESLLGLLRTLKYFKRSFGKVHVTFGQPVYLTEFLNQYQPDWQEQDYQSCHFRPIWAHEAVRHLSLKIATHINQAASINPINMLALGLLSAPRQAMGEASLARLMQSYQYLMQKTPYSSLTILPPGNAHDWIQYGERLGVISRCTHPMGDLIQTDERQAVTLTYYRNNVLHLFALPSLIACLFVNSQRYQQEQILPIIQQLYPFLKTELFLQWDPGDLQADVLSWIQVLYDQGYLLKNEKGFHATPSSSTGFAQLKALGENVMQTLERYFLTLSLLIKSGSGILDAARLEQQSTLLAQRISLLYGMNAPEFFDKSLFKVLIQELKNEKFIVENDDLSLSFQQPLEQLAETLGNILNGELKQSVLFSLNADLESQPEDAHE